MNPFSKCSSKCWTCKWFHQEGSCLAGHGDDFYEMADKEILREALLKYKSERVLTAIKTALGER